MPRKKYAKFSFYFAGTAWVSLNPMKLGMLVLDISKPYQIYGDFHPVKRMSLDLGKDFTVHIQPDFKVFLDLYGSPSLRSQVIKLLSFSRRFWQTGHQLLDISACEGQTFELISPRIIFGEISVSPKRRGSICRKLSKPTRVHISLPVFAPSATHNVSARNWTPG